MAFPAPAIPADKQEAKSMSRREVFTNAAPVSGAILAGLPFIGPVAVAAVPDPVFAALEVERAAWTAFEATCKPEDEASTAWRQSGWDREPRVQVGTYTSIVRGPDLEPVPIEEQEPKPVYLHSRAEIDRAETDLERRDRLYRQLDEDRNAIENHPLRIAAREAEEQNDEALEKWGNVYREALSTRPTTAAGALALMAIFEKRDGDMAPDWEHIRAVFDGVRVIIGGQA